LVQRTPDPPRAPLGAKDYHGPSAPAVGFGGWVGVLTA
jgi:hypothetical protein